MSNYNKMRVLGLDVFDDNLGKVETKTKTIINTISPNSFTISESDPVFKQALKQTDILVLDGKYFVAASLLLHGKNIQKNSGTDCFYHFMERANKECAKVFFLGSSNDTLERIKLRAKQEYPNVTVGFYSPPYAAEFSKAQNEEMVSAINTFAPKYVFVGMTAPKQEKWVHGNKAGIEAKIICTIGNVFDWYAGNQKQPEKIWVKLGLEWFIRTLRRPEILKRYPNVFKFFYIVILNLIKVRKD